MAKALVLPVYSNIFFDLSPPLQPEEMNVSAIRRLKMNKNNKIIKMSFWDKAVAMLGLQLPAL